MKSIFTTLGRIVIILAVAALIITGVSTLTSSTGDSDTTSMQQPPTFDGNMPARPDHDEGGSSAFGLLELVKNIGVTGLIITAYWFLQKWMNQIKRTSRLAV